MVILEEETFKKFGYYPKDLKNKSHVSGSMSSNITSDLPKYVEET